MTMPFILPDDRAEAPKALRNPGELNFAITVLLRAYQRIHGTRYQTFNDMLGALEGAKLELYRQKVAPYEDTKLAANGDVS